MGNWRRHFNTANNRVEVQKPNTTFSNTNTLPEVYSGAPNRQERYIQYENMDMDPFINAALNVIAEFSTQDNKITNLPFSISFINDEAATIGAVETLKEALNQWCYINDFTTKIFTILRKTVLYGDCIFIRDPETLKWMFIDPKNVQQVTLQENKGKKVDTYFISNLDINTESNLATVIKNSGQYTFPGSYPKIPSGTLSYGSASAASNTSRFSKSQNTYEIDAKHVIHISLNNGFDPFWPFGISILEPIFKVFKQKSLIEDSLVIYRVNRAPERRVFYIDVGSAPAHKAQGIVERIKNEMQQRRIPARTGSGNAITDAAYSPMSVIEDFYIPTGDGNRGSRIETLPGGQCLALNTLIPLLDGRTLSLDEIIKEYKDGKTNWAYSCHPTTGEVVPGIITWAGVTRKNTEVLKITLDNGKSVICTPDHKFPLKGIGFVEAKDLTVGQSMIPHYTDVNENGYRIVFENKSKVFKPVHRIVAEFLRGTIFENVHVEDEKLRDEVKNTVHHMNICDKNNKLNNDPSNLYWMNSRDHFIWHKNNNFYAILKSIKESNPDEYNEIVRRSIEKRLISARNTISNRTIERRKAVGAAISKSARSYIKSLSKEERLLRRNRSIYNLRNATDIIQEIWRNNPEKRMSRDIKAGLSISKAYNEQRKKDSSLRMKKQWSIDGYKERVFANKEIIFDKYLLSKIIEYISPISYEIDDILMICNSDQDFLDHFREINKDNNHPSFDISEGFKAQHLIRCISQANFSSFRSFTRDILIEKGYKQSESRTGKMGNIRYIKYPETVINKIVSMIGCNYKIGKIVREINSNEENIALIREANRGNTYMRDNFTYDKFSIDDLKVISLQLGFRNENEFYDSIKFANHKIISIEYLEETMDTGTLTIDGNEVLHNYHTFALDCGIFTKNSLGEINDLVYFTNLLARGLGIPSSYIPTGPEDSTNTWNDGKLGTAYIQEYRFSLACKRLQKMIVKVFDKEFKYFCQEKGIVIEPSDFTLQFEEPESFSDYRQIEKDTAYMGILSSALSLPSISKRYAFERFGGWSKEEVSTNEKMFIEENPDKIGENMSAQSPEEMPSLRSVGLSPTPMGGDMNAENGEEISPEGMEAPPTSGMDTNNAQMDTGSVVGNPEGMA